MVPIYEINSLMIIFNGYKIKKQVSSGDRLKDMVKVTGKTTHKLWKKSHGASFNLQGLVKPASWLWYGLVIISKRNSEM